MGCGNSTSSATNDGVLRASGAADPDLQQELNSKRIDKRGKVVDALDRGERPGDNSAMVGMFEMDSAGAGDQALAVKPYLGAIKAPTNPPPFQNRAPNVNLTLEYVYGYRCFDSRQNLFYTASPNKYVYMAAAIGVVHNKSNNTQQFFGAGNITTAAGHSDDIMALAIHPQRDLVATGETGANPKVCVWKSSDCTKVKDFSLGRGARAVSCLGFSADGRMLAVVDMHNDHNVRVYDWNQGSVISQDKGGPDKIMDLCWAASGNTFCTGGVKHIYFWTQQGGGYVKSKGIFGQAGEQTDFTSVGWLSSNVCVTGGANGGLYTWQANNLVKKYQILPAACAIHALNVVQDVILVGGADKKIHVLDSSFRETSCIQIQSCPRSLDKSGNRLLCGCRDGTILEVDVNGSNQQVHMESHSDGEVWGLAVHTQKTNCFVTTGDDNKMKVWDYTQRKCVSTAQLEGTPGPQRKAGQGASSMSQFPPNQQARGVAVSPHGHIAIGHNDGHVVVKRDPNVVVATLTDPKEWIEAIVYSPSGDRLAVGSHDNAIYIYDVQANYRLQFKMTGHSAMILSLDWSVDGSAMHTTCGAYELLFWETATGKQIRDGATRLKDEAWATWSAKLGWPVGGIYGGQVDMTHVNAVDRCHDSSCVAVGNDWGLVELYGFPNDKGAKSVAFRAHSEHVTNVKWSHDDRYVFSTGGYDNCVMQWRKG